MITASVLKELNGAVAPYLLTNLTDAVKVQPFSISIDAPNETGLEKMNPMMVRIFDINVGRVVNRFLNMCTTSGATAEIIYNAMGTKLSKLLNSDEPWLHCTSVDVDNTSTNIGIRNSLKTRIIARNEAIYFSGCPCHIIHNSAQKGGEASEKTCGFDVEDLVINLFYWFEKSTMRKNTLKKFL